MSFSFKNWLGKVTRLGILLGFFFFSLILSLTLSSLNWLKGAPLYWIVFYYWSLYRPEELSLLTLVILGCLMDGCYNEGLGFHFLRFFLATILLKIQQKHFKYHSFYFTWGVFGALLVTDSFFCAGISAYFKEGRLFFTYLLSPILWEGVLLTFALYPISLLCFRKLLVKAPLSPS